jgi:hypothetical protein
VIFVFTKFETGSGALPASYYSFTMGLKRPVCEADHLRVLPRLIMCGAMPLLPLNAFTTYKGTILLCLHLVNLGLCLVVCGSDLDLLSVILRGFFVVPILADRFLGSAWHYTSITASQILASSPVLRTSSHFPCCTKSSL